MSGAPTSNGPQVSAGAAAAPARRARDRSRRSRDLIDAVTPEHPVFVNRFDRSMFLANSARAQAGAASPRARRIRRTARSSRTRAGRPTGILKGSAADIVRRVIPPIPFEQRLTQVRAVLKEAREGGVTTMQDLTSAEQLRAYQELQRRGELTSRIMLRPTLDNVTHTPRTRHLARLRRRVAALHRLQGVGRRHHGQQRRDVLRAVHARSEEQGPAARHHAARRAGRRGDGDDRRAALHRLPTWQPREAARGGGREPASRRTSTRSATRATGSSSTSTRSC